MKELPYFKFHVSEWINGDITLESLEDQGAFINICSHYWFKDGKLKLDEAKRRLTEIKPNAFQSLIKKGFLKQKDGFLKISFLDEQLSQRQNKSVVNSNNGKKGGRPKKTEIKPNALFSESETKAKQKAIREEEEKNKKENKIFNQSISKILNKPYTMGVDRGITGTGQDIDSLVKQLKSSGWDEIKIETQVKAMKAVYAKEKWSFPSNYITLLTSLIENDWVQRLKDTDPESQQKIIENGKSKQPNIDLIGSSQPGSLG